MRSMRKNYYLFVSDIVTSALVCGNTLIFMRDHEYVNRVLDDLYSEICSLEIDAAYIIFDIVISRDIFRGSYVFNEINGRNHVLNSLVSIEDVNKIYHALRAANVGTVYFMSLLPLFPYIFGANSCVIYDNNYGVYDFLFKDGVCTCEIALPETCVPIASNLMRSTGVNQVYTIADNKYKLQTKCPSTPGVVELLTFFEVAEKQAGSVGYLFDDLNRVRQLRMGLEDSNVPQVEFVDNTEEMAKEAEASKNADVGYQSANASSSNKRIQQKQEPAQKKRRLGRKDRQMDDVVEVLAERKNKFPFASIAGTLGFLLLLTTGVGVAGQYYFTTSLASTRDVNESLMTNIQAYNDEAASLISYADNEYSNEMLITAEDNNVLKKRKNMTLFRVHVDDEYIRVVAGFSKKKDIKKYRNTLKNGYSILYDSVNKDVITNTGDVDISNIDHELSLELIDVNKDWKYVCVFILAEGAGT